MGKIAGKIGNGAPDVEQAKLQKAVEKAVPVSNPGCIVDMPTAAVYVVGRHSLGIEDVVIRVPFVDFINVAEGILRNVVVPMLGNVEQAIVNSKKMPPEKP